ncbi:GNAT family N-acetyltransferase [Rufibacter hautae]|uniref:GNAT family N-acetyltransferase n=1 Tax=Rufibacter hautae TaxID=2595005 RepID=A0A5B6T8B8_9BACT|nr:GNAT family N-acetyltransferase [Rufibacter hautae]KAA3436408.1 GNAT family N-acetyltransferase [Rufibacter hautae]
MIHLDTPDIRLSGATPAEYPELVAVWEASVRATHPFVTEDEIAFFRPIILHDYLKMMKLTCARNSHGAILGFAGVMAGKLEMLFLHPMARGRGIGTALLQHVIRHQGVTKVDVNEENEQALGFYQHHGFKVTKRSELDAMGKPHPILYLELDNS